MVDRANATLPGMTRWSTSAALAFSLALAPACVAGVAATPPRGQVVTSPPPPALAEVRPPPPGPAAVWIAGYWHWNGAAYTWIPGHWEHAPPGTVWYGPTYSTSTDGQHVYEPGAFRPARPPNANALR